jgi:hypothetical protein
LGSGSTSKGDAETFDDEDRSILGAARAFGLVSPPPDVGTR